MTKKDYILIANAYVTAYLNCRMSGEELSGSQEDYIIDSLIRTFQADNNKFDQEKFIDYINKKIEALNFN